jgi:hypothetical protein
VAGKNPPLSAKIPLLRGWESALDHPLTPGKGLFRSKGINHKGHKGLFGSKRINHKGHEDPDMNIRERSDVETSCRPIRIMGRWTNFWRKKKPPTGA